MERTRKAVDGRSGALGPRPRLTRRRRVLSRRIWALACILASTMPAPLNGQGSSGVPRVLPRLTTPIILDGRLDEAAWDRVPPLPFVVYQPVFRGEATERTEVRVAYDDEYLYVGARLFVTDPSYIRGDSFERDDWDSEGDFLNVLIDTFNDNETGVSFSTTPTGIRLDSEITNDAEGNWLNTNRDMVWSAATTTTEHGWFAEMRIPFSTLRFTTEDGRVVMGFSVNRAISVKNERHIFPPIEPTSETALWKPSRWRDVRFEDLEPATPLHIIPYALVGVRNIVDQGDGGDATTTRREAGLDLKYGIDDALTLDVTLNTDFAQVEVDDEQFNLTRFSLFFPEKRFFFQERAGLFQFELGSDDRLFHSRRIGLSNGRPVRILGGARLTGRTGGWDIGVLGMQTDREPGQPSESFAVARLRRRVVNSHSQAGIMMTSRLTQDGRHSFSVGLDANLRFVADDLRIAWAQTLDDAPGSPDGSFLRSSRLHAAWERRADIGLGYRLSASRSGAAFDPRVGFVRRTAFTLAEQQVSYGWFAGERSPIRLHQPVLRNTVYVRNGDGSVESSLQEFKWTTEMKSGAVASVSLNRHYESVQNSFNLSGEAIVPPGDYTFYEAAAAVESPKSRPLRLTIDGRLGSFYDGHRLAMGTRPTWVASAHLRVGADYEINSIRFGGRGQRLVSHIARLRISAALNKRLSGRAFFQRNSVLDAWSAHLRLRYMLAEGSDMYLVFDSRDVGGGSQEVTPMNSLGVTAKYTHAIR